MPDDLIHRDVLVWSEEQSALLRRLAAGERVNDAIDWENVIEEIEDLGRSELHSVESLLVRALEHLLKITAFPEGPVEHWRAEARLFLVRARGRFSPSMAQRIDLNQLFGIAVHLVQDRTIDGRSPLPLAADCPFDLADLLPADRGTVPDTAGLLARLREGGADA